MSEAYCFVRLIPEASGSCLIKIVDGELTMPQTPPSESKETDVANNRKKPYSKPEIKYFGDIKDLTLGGSTGDQELLSPNGADWRRI